jgi:hypothetical protein
MNKIFHTPAAIKNSSNFASAALLCLFFVCGGAAAEGNLARRAERLEPLLVDAANGFSKTSYVIETGKFYRWRVESDGRDQYRIVAPELFQNSWIDHISIDGKAIEPIGLQAIEFDDEGEIDVFFLAIRPGSYEFYVPNLRSQGFSGTFEIR